MDKEVKHILAYILGATDRPLRFRYVGDLWQDLWLKVYRDANFAAPCSEGVYCIFAKGTKGTELPLEWRSREERLTATSSAESELMELSEAIKAVLRMLGLLECCRLRLVWSGIGGWGSESVRTPNREVVFRVRVRAVHACVRAKLCERVVLGA